MDKAEPSKTRSAGTYRAALAAVIILSLLLVLGVIALVVGFVRQYRLFEADRAGISAAAGVPAAAGMQLAPGAHILSATTDAGKLVLHVQTPQGSEVDIVDLASGRMVSRVLDGK